MPEEKLCIYCEVHQSVLQFNECSQSKDGLQARCNTCWEQYRRENRERINDKKKQYYLDNREEMLSEKRRRYWENPAKSRLRASKSRTKIALSFFSLYGGKCSFCSETVPEFLTLDHVRGGGSSERKKIGRSHGWAYSDAVKTGIPDFEKYRVLCHNHNYALGHPLIPYENLTESGRYARNLMNFIIEGYGGKCSCCGITERSFLQLDHVNGGGTQHRLKCGSMAPYFDARKRKFPEDYRVLCSNCNCSAYRGNGICFHKRSVDSTTVAP